MEKYKEIKTASAVETFLLDCYHENKVSILIDF